MANKLKARLVRLKDRLQQLKAGDRCAGCECPITTHISYRLKSGEIVMIPPYVDPPDCTCGRWGNKLRITCVEVVLAYVFENREELDRYLNAPEPEKKAMLEGRETAYSARAE